MGSDTDERGRTLIVGCCNGKPGLLKITGRAVEILDKHDTRGTVAVGGSLYYLQRAGLFRWDFTKNEPLLLAPGGRDWHGLHYAHDRLWSVDPVQDVITEYDLSGNIEACHDWKPSGEGRLHTNDIWFEGDDLILTCFNWGVVRNGEPLGLGKNMQPHSPVVWKNGIFFCASARGEVHDEQGDTFCAPGGFTRGLLPTEEGMWVGLSSKRHHAGGTGARLQFYDWSGIIQIDIELPTNEVYAITEMGAAP